VIASCPTVGLSSKHEGCEQTEAVRRLVDAVGVGDLLGPKAERRLDLPDAPDAGDEAEPLIDRPQRGSKSNWIPPG